jgi:chromate transporter
MEDAINKTPASKSTNLLLFLIFLRLGLTSFGGPVAHIGYFRDEFVARRRWFSDREYADLVALCQFLPGPSSSQVGIAIGLTRAGWLGAVVAWLGFTLPSALLMVLAAYGLLLLDNGVSVSVLHGLKLLAVAVVAQAVWVMGRQLCTDAVRILMALMSAAIVLLWGSVFAQLLVIVAAGLIGAVIFKATPAVSVMNIVRLSRKVGIGLLLIFFTLLLGLPVLAQIVHLPLLEVVSAFYRTGSLVFGGGHVVLPLLQAATVMPGWVDGGTFIAGYGVVQAMPGPLFSFAAFLGAVIGEGNHHWLMAIVCLGAIFLPSFLLLGAVLPFWSALRANKQVQAALGGVNAAVVGLLLAALYHPVWTSAVFQIADIVLVLVGLISLMYWRLPPWLLVLVYGAGGWLYGLL